MVRKYIIAIGKLRREENRPSSRIYFPRSATLEREDENDEEIKMLRRETPELPRYLVCQVHHMRVHTVS